MKRNFITLLLCLITILLNAQSIDSMAMKEELYRLKRVSDSITRAQIAKDSLIINKEDASMPVEPGLEETPDERETQYEKMLKFQDKEKHVFRNRLLALSAGVIIIMLCMRTVINKQRRSKPTSKKENPLD